VSRLARECGVNANQVGRWLREHGHGGRARKAVASVVATPSAFVAMAVPPASPIRVQGDDDNVAVMDMQARLPNGVALDLRGVQVRHVNDVIEALGRLRCFASTKT
jgi:transposase